MFFSFTNDKDDERYEYSLQVLFEENYDRVYNVAIAILLNKELAKDAVQETFLKAFLKIDTLKDKSKFNIWICTITRNVCKDMLRQICKQRDKNISIYDEDGSIKNNIAELSDFNVPDKIYEDNEARQELKAVIGEMDIDTQTIINLRYFEDLTYEQIAEYMDIKENNVRVKLYRAKRKMAEKIKKYLAMGGVDKDV
jgi:RNA polymerase sigma-70 factor (ECF subfamily)